MGNLHKTYQQIIRINRKYLDYKYFYVFLLWGILSLCVSGGIF